MSTFTIHEQVFELLTEAFEGIYLDPAQPLYVCLAERMASTDEESIAELCDEWDEMTTEEFLNVAIGHQASEYGGYYMTLPEFEALSENVIAW